MINVLAQWNRVRQYYVKDVFLKRVNLSQHNHQELVYALRNHDANHAEQIVRRHNQRALSDYVAYLQSTGHMSNKDTTP